MRNLNSWMFILVSCYNVSKPGKFSCQDEDSGPSRPLGTSQLLVLLHPQRGASSRFAAPPSTFTPRFYKYIEFCARVSQ